VAKELVRLGDSVGSRFVVVDNHLTSNVIFSVLPVDGVSPLPAGVWDHVGAVREALLSAIEDLSPREWSFVFTNVLTEGVRGDRDVVGRLIELAARRQSRYVPVRLACSKEEFVRRVTLPDRKQRHKCIDPDGVRAFVESTEVLDIDHPDCIDFNVTSLPATQSAARILDHIRMGGQWIGVAAGGSSGTSTAHWVDGRPAGRRAWRAEGSLSRWTGPAVREPCARRAQPGNERTRPVVRPSGMKPAPQLPEAATGETRWHRRAGR
jgi:hypothetical protein